MSRGDVVPRYLTLLVSPINDEEAGPVSQRETIEKSINTVLFSLRSQTGWLARLGEDGEDWTGISSGESLSATTREAPYSSEQSVDLPARG